MRGFLTFLLLGSLLAACTTEPLDMTGAIHCGDAGTNQCPGPDWVCRIGRCCPASSSVNTCPAGVTPDPTGATPCESGLCGSNFVCRQGRCCPPSSTAAMCPVGVVPDPTGGTPCDAGGVCGSDYVCRLGRCCPPMSTATMCPVGVMPDPVGATPCDVTGACGSGFLCRLGRCCPPMSTASMCPVGVSPDPTGATPCEAGECGAGFVCRLGRCCPPTSTAVMCPVGVMPDPAGATPCDHDLCGGGFVCRWGRCCPPTSSVNACPTAANLPMDTTGRYSCAAGVCPGGTASSYICRWGRCCERGSAPGTCPTAVDPDLTGLYECQGVGVCPSGYACKFGHCCDSARIGTSHCAPRGLGNPCVPANADCEIPVSGLTRFCVTNELGANAPGGLCVAFGCNPMVANSCGPTGECVRDGFCLRTCALPPGVAIGPCGRFGDTGTAYSCFSRDTTSTTNTMGYCLPDCARDSSICPAGSICDTLEHSCRFPCTVDTTCPDNLPVCRSMSCTRLACTGLGIGTCPATGARFCLNGFCSRTAT